VIATWYIPSTAGDFRITALDKDRCELEVIDPTPREQQVVMELLAKGLEEKWTTTVELSAVGKTVLELQASASVVGAELARRNGFAPKGRITAVRCSGDRIETTEELDEAFALTALPAAEAAVTVRRPTPCCPYTRTGPDRRASEVLQTFATREQWGDWERDGVLTCRGGTTGHVYRIAHRHSPIGIKQGRICADMTDGFVLHFHDSLRPPAEEVLATKLILEHREPWLRNHSTCLSDRAREIFANPLGHPTLDGRPDASMFAGIGGAVVGGLLGKSRFGRRLGEAVTQAFLA
jgi:hypothetical protein